jgi:hypothetical protein
MLCYAMLCYASQLDPPYLISSTTSSATFGWANSTNAWTNGTFCRPSSLSSTARPILEQCWLTTSPAAGPPINRFRFGIDNQFANDCSDAPPQATECGNQDPREAYQNRCCDLPGCSTSGFCPAGVAPNVFTGTITGLRPGYPYSESSRTRNPPSPRALPCRAGDCELASRCRYAAQVYSRNGVDRNVGTGCCTDQCRTSGPNCCRIGNFNSEGTLHVRTFRSAVMYRSMLRMSLQARSPTSSSSNPTSPSRPTT